MQRAVAVALEDERIVALGLWGSLARGDADEWSDIDFVVCVEDGTVEQIVAEFAANDWNSRYGQSAVALSMPQRGLEGGGFVAVTYVRAGLPIHVDWYVVPASIGVPISDTKPLFRRPGCLLGDKSFAALLEERPSSQSIAPPKSDLEASMIPLEVTAVVRGRFESVLIDGKPATSAIEAYDELGRRIAALPESHADLRAPLFYHLGLARRGR
jgi:predicted nucleotidyltransferase